MSRIIQMQNDFTVGEMDPKLLSRNDLKQYGSGLATALNVVVQPHGGSRYAAVAVTAESSGAKPLKPSPDGGLSAALPGPAGHFQPEVGNRVPIRRF